jgi:hypothetical protein
VLENATKTKPARLVTTDATGSIMFVYFDGKVEKMKIDDYSSSHFFEFQDVDADNIKDFIFIDDNLLEVYNNNKKLIFNYEFAGKINHKPVYYYFSERDRKIGVVCESTNEIFLFNSNGSLYEGFPLRGKTQFSIGYLSPDKQKFNLIVGSDVNFIYNYEVN